MCIPFTALSTVHALDGVTVTVTVQSNPARTMALLMRGDTSNTTLGPKLTASKLRDYYARQINVSKVRAGGPGWA